MVAAVSHPSAARRRLRDVLGPAPRRPPAFVVIAAVVGMLNTVGLVMILSASSVAALRSFGSSWYFFNRQLAWSLVGVVVFVVVSRIDYRIWMKGVLPLLILAFGSLIVVLVPHLGIQVDGARRWLGMGSLRFQPSELAKLALLVFAASVLTRRADSVDDFHRGAKPVIAVFAGFAVLVLVEPDLDSTIVLALIALSVIAVGGVPLRQIGWLAMLGLGAASVLSFAVPYRRRRLLVFLHPWDDAGNTGYQIAQSLIALGSGGVDGVGLGSGRAKWAFLPNPHTDFIFAIVGEELGLVGCLMIVALFVGFGLAGLHIARSAPDRLGMLLAAGVTSWVVGQALINIGAVIGLLPVSGIPLPFLSAGGSALVFTMAAAGILANVARQCPQPERHSRSAVEHPSGRRRRA